MLSNTSQSITTMEGIYRINTFHEYVSHSSQMQDEYHTRLKLEEKLSDLAEGKPFAINGFCCICNKDSSFYVDLTHSYEFTNKNIPIPNWREHLLCEHCRINNRMRAALHMFCSLINGEQTAAIYITEALTNTYKWIKKRYQHTIGSEYWGEDILGGAIINGIRHENMMDLSFKDSFFDYVLSFDVLEHVPNPDRAFAEVYRILKVGGYFIWTAPFDITATKDIIRATLQENGTIEHILPPEIHGNPTDPQNGSLCFRYFSWHSLERLYKIGFKDVYCLAYWSSKQAYLGKEQYMFIAQK